MALNPPSAIAASLRRRFARWLDRRLPASDSITLNHRRLFILPSGACLGLVCVIVLLWLVATNYENNLVFAVAMLLAAVLVVAIFHSYANLAGITLTISHADAAFAGDKARLTVRLSQQGRRFRDGIHLAFADANPVTVCLDGEEAEAVLHAQTRRRGWLQPGRLRVETVYPLGLFRVWTLVALRCEGVVYPRPVPGARTSRGEVANDTARGLSRTSVGSEDYLGLEDYRPGEPLNHVAWKQMARTGQMMSKRYGDPPRQTRWLDWNDFAGLNREARLSRLCHWLLCLSRERDPYGLRLPGFRSSLGNGGSHRDRLLRALALFEVEEGGRDS